MCICSSSIGFAYHAVPLLRYKWLKCRALRNTSQRLLHLFNGILISDVTLLRIPKTPATGQFIKKLAQGKTKQKIAKVPHCIAIYMTLACACVDVLLYVCYMYKSCPCTDIHEIVFFLQAGFLFSRCLGPSLPHGLTLIPTWIRNYIHKKH